jgi:hypothetical protein
MADSPHPPEQRPEDVAGAQVSPDTSGQSEGDAGFLNSRLRQEIVHGIQLQIPVSKLDIAGRLREQRVATTLSALKIAGVLASITFLVLAFVLWRQNVIANTFAIRSSDYVIAPGQRYVYAVSQNGQYLLDAYLEVETVVTAGGREFFKVNQVAPDANVTYYWEQTERAFLQFFHPEDKHPLVRVPTPLRAGMKWTTDIYPDESHSRNKEPVRVRFTAGEESVRALPYGEVTCIRVDAVETDGSAVQSLWVAQEAPIAMLQVEADDPTFIAELMAIEPAPGI